jgi:uncharacterized protein YceK
MHHFEVKALASLNMPFSILFTTLLKNVKLLAKQK